MGFGSSPIMPEYPIWMYHDTLEPRLVNNKEEEVALRAIGYDEFSAGMLSNKTTVNWYWDLEDLSSKQLSVFARDEYGVELPPDASQEVLYKAICELSRTSPQNENRLVLIAQVMEMNLDATMEEIRRMQREGALGIEMQNEEFEVTM